MSLLRNDRCVKPFLRINEQLFALGVKTQTKGGKSGPGKARSCEKSKIKPEKTRQVSGLNCFSFLTEVNKVQVRHLYLFDCFFIRLAS